MKVSVGVFFLFLPFGSPWVSISNPGKFLKAATTSLGLSDVTQDPSSRRDGRILELNGVERVFCLSDLHTDSEANQIWLLSMLRESDFSKKDLIVVAGDISHDMNTFHKSMSALVEKAHVVFVPGNHEAWVDQRHKPNSTSFEKLEEVYKACHDLGVITKSTLVQCEPDNCPHPLWILPLESWYDGTLSFNEKLGDLKGWPWADFRRCVWKEPDFPPPAEANGPLPTGLVEYFLEKNEPLFTQNPFPSLFPSEGPDPKCLGIMTVSHFLPNKQSLPDWKDLENPQFQEAWLDHGLGGMSAKFAKVAGSSLLDQQIRSLLSSEDVDSRALKRHIHVFGHSHRPKDFEYRGIRYVHNPLGKPRERQLRMVAPDVDFQLVWDTRSGEVAGETILRYWEEKAGGVEALQSRMKSVKPDGRYNRRKGSAFKMANNETELPSLTSKTL